MRQLNIQNFSCITHATLELGQLTVLVGPQASGKSVISKLCYFFVSLLMRDQATLIQEGVNLEGFRQHIREEFIQWFPVSAWGRKKFSITFTIGSFEIKIARSERAGKVSNNVRMWFSSALENHYSTMFDAAKELKAKNRNTSEFDFEYSYQIREHSEKLLRDELKDDYIQFQLFIPAGRSFFTSIGKAVAAFEQARVLEPVTLQFGRTFAAIRDQRRRRDVAFRGSKWMELKFAQLLGGRLNFERDREYVDSQDGRRVPISALSSGQQELLPLLLSLEYWAMGNLAQRSRRLIYIEEPEAHLFPSAQSALVEAMANMVVPRKAKEWIGLLITTHSPYVLAKINNLIKAGRLADKADEQRKRQISAVVDSNSWIQPNLVKAYALKDGDLCPLVGESGLIDAEYLDEVSGEIAKEFSALLEIEISDGTS